MKMSKKEYEKFVDNNISFQIATKVTHDVRKGLIDEIDNLIEDLEISVYENDNIELSKNELDLISELKSRLNNLLNTDIKEV